MKPFYITTPIYYVNDRPHIGTAYSTIAADTIARYQKLRGRPTHFLTGLDEHGLKLERRAREVGMTPQAFVDSMAEPFREAWQQLSCAHDDFIRTTEPRHEQRAQELWRRVQAAGDIYLGDYEDWYCVGCEVFYTEKDLLAGNICPQHKKPVERVKEQSYFFKLSAYTERLLAFYEANPTFVQPVGRFNEVKAFVREGLRDLSVSRTSFTWGIPVPDDSRHVMYVWFDALANYISALSGPAAPGVAELYDRHWPPHGDAIHLVGKDILRFHAVYWPAFLMSAGIEAPTQIWAHGWLTVNGEKMSKSLGNFIPPGPLVEAFGADVVRYYLLRDVALGQDGDFSHKNLLARYNGELANGLGNLLNRVLASIVKNSLNGRVPDPALSPELPLDAELIRTAQRCAQEAARHLDELAPHRALESIFELCAATNKYVDQTAPWALVKSGDTARLSRVVYQVLEAVRWLGVMIWPVMPNKADALMAQLGLPAIAPVTDQDAWPTQWGLLRASTETAPGTPLFPRIDDKQEAELMQRLGVTEPEVAAAPKTKKKTVTEPTATPKTSAAATSAADGAASTIVYDDFAKVALRVGLVLSAERVPKSDKLLRLMVDAGDPEPRQILAGIGKHYEPEAITGQRVVIVANLAPRKLMGLESHGMVLAAGDGEVLRVLPAPDVAPGSPVK